MTGSHCRRPGPAPAPAARQPGLVAGRRPRRSSSRSGVRPGRGSWCTLPAAPGVLDVGETAPPTSSTVRSGGLRLVAARRGGRSAPPAAPPAPDRQDQGVARRGSATRRIGEHAAAPPGHVRRTARWPRGAARLAGIQTLAAGGAGGSGTDELGSGPPPPPGGSSVVSRRQPSARHRARWPRPGVISTTSRPPPSSGTRMTMPRPSLVTSSGPSPVRGFIAAMLSPLRPTPGSVGCPACSAPRVQHHRCRNWLRRVPTNDFP